MRGAGADRAGTPGASSSPWQRGRERAAAAFNKGEIGSGVALPENARAFLVHKELTFTLVFAHRRPFSLRCPSMAPRLRQMCELFASPPPMHKLGGKAIVAVMPL